jgi:hypothetical protein
MIKNWQGFDFVQKNKDTLMVTIGDSWTWEIVLVQQKINDK